MAIRLEDLAARLERLEHRVREKAMERPQADGARGVDGIAPADAFAERVAHGVWSRIPFGAWLKISGPTFAVMAVGSTALWSSQQATTQQILDLQASTTARILEMERSTTDKILEVQDRILELQQSTTGRMLEMQRQILEMQREERSGRE